MEIPKRFENDIEYANLVRQRVGERIRQGLRDLWDIARGEERISPDRVWYEMSKQWGVSYKVAKQITRHFVNGLNSYASKDNRVVSTTSFGLLSGRPNVEAEWKKLPIYEAGDMKRLGDIFLFFRDNMIAAEVSGVEIPKVIQGNRKKAEAYAAGRIYGHSPGRVDKVPEPLRKYVPPKSVALGSEEARASSPYYEYFEGGFLESQAKLARKSSRRSVPLNRASRQDEDLVSLMKRVKSESARHIPGAFLED